jgi:hypothetical protein
MSKCVNCKHFRMKDKFCDWCGAYLTEQSSRMNVKCEGYRPLRPFHRIEKHHRIPDLKLVRCEQHG